MFYKLEPRPKNANCPHCKSTETFVSLYKESRYCAITATELITSQMKFAWRIKKKTRNYICECPFTKGTYYFID